MRKKYPKRRRKVYPEPGVIYKGREKLILMCILPNGSRMYSGFLQIYVIR
jgi:hypothetical protein